MDTPTIGARIKQLRGTTMTQRELAERSGVSLSMIRALEQNQRHTPSISSLQALARALDTDIATLLGKVTAMPDGPDSGIVAIRAALTPVDDLIADVVYPGEPLTVREAQRTADYLWGAYWAGRYDLLGGLLPDALVRLRATLRTVKAADRARAAAALALAYQAAGDTLVHLGHPDIAWLALREALAAAGQGDDELLAVGLRVSVSWQLLVAGRYREAEQVAMTAAKAVEPAGDAGLPELTAYGVLTVTAATAAARALDSDRTAELLDVSREVAGRIGHDRSGCQTTFGPAKVAIMEVDCAVVLDRHAEAVAAAKLLPRDAALPLVSQARHLADLSYAHTRLGNRETALTLLLTQEQMAPTWIRQQAFPRQVVTELLRHGTPPTPLRKLARRLGVSGGSTIG